MAASLIIHMELFVCLFASLFVCLFVCLFVTWFSYNLRDLIRYTSICISVSVSVSLVQLLEGTTKALYWICIYFMCALNTVFLYSDSLCPFWMV